ncbi:hypothetical protein WDU94_003315 [Cyamophila willieti]
MSTGVVNFFTRGFCLAGIGICAYTFVYFKLSNRTQNTSPTVILMHSLTALGTSRQRMPKVLVSLESIWVKSLP